MDRIIQKKKWTLKRILGMVAGTAIVLFVLYQIFFRDSSYKVNIEKSHIIISTVKQQEFQEFIPITGTVIPVKTVYLEAVEGGRVEEIYTEAGKMVEKGDKILRLENTNLRMDIMQKESSLIEQTNQMRNTQLELERQKIELKNELTDYDYKIKQAKRVFDQNKRLLENKIISRQEYEESRDEYYYHIQKRKLAIESARQDSIYMSLQIEQLASLLKQLESNLAIVKERLENLTLTAPVSGQLTSLSAEYVGEIRSSGERLGQIDVLDGFKIRAAIDEHYLPRIHINQTGEFDLSGQTHTLVIKKIFPEIINGNFNIDLEFIQTEPEDIRQGMTVHIRLALGDLSKAITLPRGGFYQTSGGQWVYRLDASGDYAVKQPVKLGRQNTEVYEVLDGLEPGDRVITSSYDHFGNADKLLLN